MGQLIFAAIATIVLALFCMANTREVEIDYIVGDPIRIRMIVLLAGVFLAGMVTAHFHRAINQIKRRRQRIHAEYERDLE